MNFKPNHRLTLHTQHINSERCLCLREHVLANHCIVRELILATPEKRDGKHRLKRLDIVVTERFINDFIEYGLDEKRAVTPLYHLRCSILDDKKILSRVLLKNNKTILALSWQTYIASSKQIEFHLQSIMPLGKKLKSPLDTSYDAIATALSSLDNLGMSSFYHYVKNCIQIDIIAGLCHIIFNKNLEYDISIEDGGLSIQKDGADIHLIYDINLKNESKQIEEPNHDAVEIYDWPYTAKNSHINRKRQAATQGDTLEHVSKLQEDIYANKTLSLSLIQTALNEAKSELHPSLVPALLYVIHQHDPSHDNDLKLFALSQSNSSDDDFLIYKFLESIYKKQGNDTILLELKQRHLKRSDHTPRMAIETGIEIAEILAQNMGHYTQAIKRLDGMKVRVSMYANTSQKLDFAKAYHRAQGTGMAIHLLRQYMNQSTKKEDIADFGYAVASMLLEHNEPPQSIINTCANVLEQVPKHIETQKIFAHSLESCGRLEDAAFAYELILDHLSLDYESAMARKKLTHLPKLKTSEEKLLKDAIQTAQKLEKIYGLLEREAQQCIVLKQQLRLKPDDINILAKLLKYFESITCYEEMVQICLNFLEINQENINPDHEISIRLTLHNIFEQKLLNADEANKHLGRAREIAALDPRVLSTEIERYKRRGLIQEQIGLRQALIDVLPNDEAITQILELVRIYEELGYNISEMNTLLRKAHSLNPQNREVLLELRKNLRKSGQLFELASVLEKLARVTSNNQSRKSILLEASETQRKLENKTLAQKLYNEAQLYSPINPQLKTDYLPSFLGGNKNEQSDEMWKNLFSADSQIDAKLISDINDAVNDYKAFAVLSSNSLSLVSGIELGTDEHTPTAQIQAIQALTVTPPPIKQVHTRRNKAAQNHLETTLVPEDISIDESAPLEKQISQARLKGNSKALLERLLRSIEDIKIKDQQPRVLQEIGCIYLYDFNNYDSAKVYLERASDLSVSVAEGEQTLNALEMIYKALEQYKELAEIYEKKREISTIPTEKKRYEILAAQLYYSRLSDTQKAIDTLEKTLKEAPKNETALQLLAQIYIDVQNDDKAIETLEKTSKLFKKGSKAHAKHLLRLVTLYTKNNRINAAKNTLRELLNDNNHVDKLAVIEQYKRICRTNDQWEELLEILNDELCHYLHLPRENFDLSLFTENKQPEIPFGYASHTVREYADVLYYKLQNIPNSVKLYRTLAKLHPDDNYPIKMLEDIVALHPKSTEAIEALLTTYLPELLSKDESKTSTSKELNAKSSHGDSWTKEDFHLIKEIYICHKNADLQKAKELLSLLEKHPRKDKRACPFASIINMFKLHWDALEKGREL